MVRAVEFRVKDNGTFLFLNNLPNKLEKIGNREVWNLTQFGAGALIRSAKNVGQIKPWRNILMKFGVGINPKKIRKNTYAIEIPSYGIKLDSMKPHHVSLKRGRNITKWAGDKLGRKTGSVFVRKHPFINAGFQRMVAQAEITVNNIANKAVK